MYVYYEIRPGQFGVGYYTPSGVFILESTHAAAADAAARVSYLNGGAAPT